MSRNTITPISEAHTSSDSSLNESRVVSSFDFDNNKEPTKPKNIIKDQKIESEKNKPTIITNDETYAAKNETKNQIRKMLVFFITNFGMLLLVLGYIFIGALLFQTLEQHQEIQNCEVGMATEQEMISNYTQNIFNYIYFNTTNDVLNSNGSLDGPDKYSKVIDVYILEIRKKVIDNFQNNKYYGQQDCEASSLWQMQSAVLFTVTVVTTIGYGHIYPTTWQGQIVIICYAIIGIPLFLMTTAKISIMLANIFAFMYKYVVLFPCNCYVSCKKASSKSKVNIKEEKIKTITDWDGSITPRSNTELIQDDKEDEYDDDDEDNTKVPLFIILGFFFGFLMLGGFLFNQLENWDLVTGLYFSYVSLSTMGFGDYVPGINELLSGSFSTATTNLIVTVIYLFIGISVLGMCFNLMNSTIVDKINTISKALKNKNMDEFNSENKTEISISHQNNTSQESTI